MGWFYLKFQWKSFDFGPETSVDRPSIAKPTKSNKKTGHSRNSLKADNKYRNSSKALDFYELVSPKKRDDLIVHAKKLQEIEGWLKSVSNSGVAKVKT